MSKALLIAGYYRSGTSALSGTLNLAGVDIVNSDEHNEHNPRGYFENPVLIGRDIDILRRLDRDWHDIRPMPPDWWKSPDAATDAQFILGELKARHAESPVWAVKHPHLCRLLPLYDDAARRVSGQAPGVIQIYRDPWTVAHSQFKKNGLSRSHALLLWASYVLDAEYYSRRLDRVILDYELLVKDSRRALQQIGHTLGFEFPNRSPQDLRNISRFITPNLRRSDARGRESTPAPLRCLVEDLWQALLEEADAAHLDGLRERFDQHCALLEDLGTSRLSVMPSLAGQLANVAAAGDKTHTEAPAEGSPLRPSERTDVAEKNSLEAALARCDAPPTIDVIVAVSPGRVEAAFDTESSLDRQWRPAARVCFVSSDPDLPQRDDWHGVKVDETLLEAISRQMRDLHGDYVAIVDAGDRLEPDACLRMALFAVEHERPVLIYSDEIVANARDPWVRYKPDFDIQRLRGLHYIGGWLLCARAFVQSDGPLNAALPGAEDLDLALRVHDAGGAIAHLPEALYARAPDSVRQAVDLATLRGHVRTALDAHLERTGRIGQVVWNDGPVPGSVLPRHAAPADRPISLVLLCNTDDARHVGDLDSARLSRIMQTLPIKHLVCAGVEQRMIVETRQALDRLAADNPAPGRLHVVIADSDAGMLRDVTAVSGDETVVFLDLDAHTDDPTWLGHLHGEIADSNDRVGMVGARADYRAADAEWRMSGPLLLGGRQGVSVLGLGRPAGDPGPGGWLLGPQSADGVAPPCVAVRGDLLRTATLDERLVGAALWLELSMQIWQRGYAVVWDPSVSVRCARPPEVATGEGPALAEASRLLRERWGCASRHHHPMLALDGDGLVDGAPGLARSAPPAAPYALLSGSPDGAELAAEWLRAARMSGRMQAGWAPEPVSITALRRLAPEAWLRINPARPLAAPDAPAYRTLYTRVPAEDAALREIGVEAAQVYATSPTLADALRKRSYNRMRPEFVLPRLARRVWADVAAIERVGRSRPRVLWVDEGDPPAWMTDLLSLGGIEWFIVEGGTRHYDGPVATRKIPEDELGWRELFLEAAPNLVIRPTREATWMDCQILLRGAACGAVLVADRRLHWPQALPVQGLGPRYDDWRKTLSRLIADSESLSEAGAQTREAMERIGWIEETHPETLLFAADEPLSYPITGTA